MQRTTLKPAEESKGPKEFIVKYRHRSAILPDWHLRIRSNGKVVKDASREKATRFSESEAIDFSRKHFASPNADEYQPAEVFRVDEPEVPKASSVNPSPISNDVEVGYFENGLRIDKNALDDGLVEQPGLFQKSSERFAMALSRRDQAKDIIKQEEGRLYITIREDLVRKGEKPTEAMLKALVDSHSDRAKAVRNYVALIEECATWEGMKDSYQQRGYVLKELNALYLAGYFGESSARGTQGQIANKQYEDDKAKIREARRNRDQERHRK